MQDTMADFTQFRFPKTEESSRQVYRIGQGPGIVLMHELPGMILQCVDLACRLAARNFTVYLPLLFGTPGQALSFQRMVKHTVQLCLSQELYCFAMNQSSPITDWLRQLCQHVHAECGDRGVGVIGMCLTRGFILSLMADESVIAPVASQPSLPFGITTSHRAALGVSQDDLEKAKQRAQDGVPILALRFSEDIISPSAKLETLRREFGGNPVVVENSQALCWQRGEALETIEINSRSGNPFELSRRAHAVLTIEYREQPEHPTHRVFERVVSFLQEQFNRVDEDTEKV